MAVQARTALERPAAEGSLKRTLEQENGSDLLEFGMRSERFLERDLAPVETIA
jgi:hypothetical protein